MVIPKHTDKDRTDWKAEIHDYDKLLALDPEYFASRCLSEPTLAILLGLITTAEWKTRYHSDADTLIEEAVIKNWYNSAVRELLLECEAGNLILRQNPLDNCQLEQSIDDGVSWTLAFDFGLCLPDIPPNTGDNYCSEFVYNQTINILNEQYGETECVECVAPDIIYSEDGENANRDHALCNALGIYVDMCCGAAIEHNNDENFLLNVITAGLGLLLFIVTLPAAPIVWLTVGVAIATFSVGVWSAIVLQSNDVYEDTAARADVVCCMYSYLKGATLTNSAWLLSLTECDFGEGDTFNQDAIKDLCEAFLPSLDLYLAFIKALNTNVTYSKAGIQLPCPCEESWSHVFLSANLPLCITEIQSGSYDEINNWYFGDIDNTQKSFNTMYLTLKSQWTEPTIITRLQMGFVTLQGNPFGTRASTIKLNNSSVTAATMLTGTGGTYSLDTGAISIASLNIQWGVAIRVTLPEYDESELINRMEIRSVTIEGTGFDPFEECELS